MFAYDHADRTLRLRRDRRHQRAGDRCNCKNRFSHSELLCERSGAGPQPAHSRSQFIAQIIVPENTGRIRGISVELLRSWNNVQMPDVSCSGTAPAV